MSGVFLGQSQLQALPRDSDGGVVERDGEVFYRIGNYDAMPPFFMTLVSAYDHWMFVSSTGGLTCGRRDPGHALFPYTTDDKVHDAAAHTGPVTCLLVDDGERTRLWKPFCRQPRVYRVTRNLFKSLEGNRLVFEEINHDLGLVFSYSWSSGDSYGFIRESRLLNTGGTEVVVNLIDGIRNLLPSGVEQALQARKSTLVDGYKQAEAVTGLAAGLFSLSSILTDRAEPSEALQATVAWSVGLDQPGLLLTDDQVGRFCEGHGLEAETTARGKRCAFLVNDRIHLAAGAERRWFIVADIDHGPAEVANLLAELKTSMTPEAITRDIANGTRRLRQLVGHADGSQAGADPLTIGRHFSNTLFNIMRGGVFDSAYSIPMDDFVRFVEEWNRPLSGQARGWREDLGEQAGLAELNARAAEAQVPDLTRLALEYLPLTFSRRHGDPSRPWNHFSIKVRNEDGSNCLTYQGNWRDIFQNWEALAWSYPDFTASFIAKFVNASTADGYNAYRISRGGFDWEVLDPSDPWSNIGYWGDHQVGYLYRLLDLSRRQHPGLLEQWLESEIFVYADVPYRLRNYSELLRDPRNTVDYDETRAARIQERVDRLGADGRLVSDADGGILRVNLVEKLLVSALAKLGNLVPGGGIWMNTQRPEWNDANNALVGYGLSVVTLCHLRSYMTLLAALLEDASAESFSITAELEAALLSLRDILKGCRELLQGPLSASDRRAFMDATGGVMDRWRRQVYDGFTGRRRRIGREDLVSFVQLALEWIDHSIEANEREDGLFHAYNLLRPAGDGVELDRLDIMLEGQVAVLGSGFLEPSRSLDLLRKLRRSSLYREDQQSYLLYPDRTLPGFLEKNRVPENCLDECEAQRQALARGDSRYLVRDDAGVAHFRSRFRNASVLQTELAADPGMEPETAAWLLSTYERVFLHQRFTGRSGSMYKYEGLGCIYWHMVSKLALAVAEIAVAAHRAGADAQLVAGLAERYREIRDGLGLHKSPAAYGAFPTDPYSHTPGFAGVQQPGLTGQVKEDVIARFIQLGVWVERGELSFSPVLLEAGEFLRQPQAWTFVTNGTSKTIELPADSLGFTLCGVPVVYHRGGRGAVTLTDAEGNEHRLDRRLDPVWSRSLFARDGRIQRLVVEIGPVDDGVAAD